MAALSLPKCVSSHSRAVAALVMVSCVVNVLEATINRVVSGSHCCKACAMSVPSTLETKMGVSSGCPKALSA